MTEGELDGRPYKRYTTAELLDFVTKSDNSVEADIHPDIPIMTETHEVDVEDIGKIGLRKECAAALTEESRLYSALWWAEDSARNNRRNLLMHKDTIAVYAPEDTRREKGLTELKNLEQKIQKAEDHSTKTHKAWIAQCRKIMKLAGAIT